MPTSNPTQSFDHSLLEQHYSTRVIKGHLKYLEKKFTLEKAKEIVDKTGLSWEFLNEETNWVSDKYANRFLDILIKEQGIDSNFSYLSGKICMSKELLGPVQLLIMQLF